MAALFLLVVLVASTQTDARSLFDNPFSPSSSLSLRQTTLPSVPAQCKPTCDPINTIIANTCTVERCCSNDFVRGWFNCVLCVGKALNLTNAEYSSFQDTINNVHDECGKRGFSTPILTFPGQGPSSSAASSASRPSSATRSAPTSLSSAPPSSSTTVPPPPPPPPPTITQETISTPDSPTTAAANSTNSPSSSSQVNASWLVLFVTSLATMMGLRI